MIHFYFTEDNSCEVQGAFDDDVLQNFRPTENRLEHEYVNMLGSNNNMTDSDEKFNCSPKLNNDDNFNVIEQNVT